MTTRPDDVGGVPSPRRTDETAGEGTRPTATDDEATGLPGFRTWRAVYGFVLGVFVLWVGLLALLTARFS